MRWKFVLLTIVCLCLTACAGEPDEASPRQSAWGTVFAVGQAAQRNAPILQITNFSVFAAWTEADDGNVLHMARQIDGTKSGVPQSLPIPTAYPFMHTWVAQPDGGAHLFWLDAVFDNPQGDTLLWLARVNRDLEMPRNHVRLSQIRADAYDTLSVTEERTLVVFSGGARGEPSLYMLTVDTIGRPSFPEWLTSDVRFPRLTVSASGQPLVYWLRASNGQVMRAQLNDTTLTAITSLTDGLPLEQGDRIESFDVASDNTHTYLLWNISRADGTPEAWLSSRFFDSNRWTAPAQLTMGTPASDPFVTGFNGGSALRVNAGETALRWAQVANGRYDVVPMVAQIGDSLRVVYLQAGEIVAVQALVALGQDLVGLPEFKIDRNRHLYVAWSEPTATGLAELNMISTRALIGDVRLSD